MFGPPQSQPPSVHFWTDNVKLGAILATLGFPLRDPQPATIDFDEVNKNKRCKWWFSERIVWGDAELEARRIENWYRHKAEFETQNPLHPVTFMRQGLDAREWLNDVIHGHVQLPAVTVGPLRVYPTQDIKFASVLKVARYQLLKYSDRTFMWMDDGKIAPKWREFETQYDPSNPDAARPIPYIRQCLRNADDLRLLMRDPRCVPQIMMKFRDNDVTISENASRRVKHLLFDL